MRVLLVSIAPRPGTGPVQQIFGQYTSRLATYVACETLFYRGEQAFLDSLVKHKARTTPWLVLLDSRGVQVSSESLATRISDQQASSRQLAIFAIGPADGWSPSAREHASLLLSLGPMTLPHELARVVLAEQLYRAFTILAGHPYHSGHSSL